MKLTVVTGWSHAGWALYGRQFIEGFAKHWPAEVDLIVYGEERTPMKRGEWRDLYSIPEALATLDLYNAPVYRGLEVAPNWKQSAKDSGYNWRYDAWKFCRQGLIPWACAQDLPRGSLMCWLDGDVTTNAPVPAGFIEALLPRGKDLAYLGREPKHSEIGFQLYRVGAADPMLMRFSDLYTSREILTAREWHSAFAFDIARSLSCVDAHTLTPGGRGNVWETSPLARYMTHNKGDRKNAAAARFNASKR